MFDLVPCGFFLRQSSPGDRQPRHPARGCSFDQTRRCLTEGGTPWKNQENVDLTQETHPLNWVGTRNCHSSPALRCHCRPCRPSKPAVCNLCLVFPAAPGRAGKSGECQLVFVLVSAVFLCDGKPLVNADVFVCYGGVSSPHSPGGLRCFARPVPQSTL